MRRITLIMRADKGCEYCEDRKGIYADGRKRGFCPYDECPYEELDEFETYEDFFKSKGDPFEALRKTPTSTEYRRYYMREYKDKKPKK